MNFTHIDTVFKTELFFALAALMSAFLLAFFATPLARKLAFRCRCLDIPDGKRKMHSEPIPYFGGIAILVGFAVAAAAFSFLLTGSIAGEIAVMLVGGIGICLVGALDDMYDIRARYKFLAQIAIASFTVYFGGAIEYTTIFGFSLDLGIFSMPVTVLWIVLIINAVNLIDGLDGLAGGVSALEAFTLLATSLIMGDPICCIASAALCGAVLGFLPYNAHRATIFMGDAGAMLIGYIMACISVFGLFKSQALFSIVVPALIFALPVMDTLHAFCRRIMRGQNPFKADRQHLHHKLLENGFTARQSVLAIYLASAVFCVASVLYMRYPFFSVVLCVADLCYLEALKNDKKFLWRIKKKDAAHEVAKQDSKI
jgi:UDP-GlcNAc:undecaprenyl-phosphate GlcNAc-1-phosphate transferase